MLRSTATSVRRTCLIAALSVLAARLAPAQETLFVVEGDTIAERMSPVARCGDVNSDGVPDFVVGAPNWPDALQRGLIRMISGADGSVLFDIEGQGDHHLLGNSVSDAGDFNADGVPDFVAGATHSDTPTQNAGLARVYSGRGGEVLAEVHGVPGGLQFGYKCSAAGDVNADGYDDVIVGAFSGYVRIILGPDGSEVRHIGGLGTAGPAVSEAGDVNQDGYDDYLIGTAQDGTKGYNAGRARLYSGLDDSVIYSVYGDEEYDYLGASVAGLGDVDGDGIPDFAAGATESSPLGGGGSHGWVRVYSGADGSIIRQLAGIGPEPSYFGYSLDGGFDVNGDAVPDIIVGAPKDQNGFYPLLGSISVFSGKTGTRLWYSPSTHTPHWYGRNVALLDDMTGDGLAEFAVGDPFFKPDGVFTSGRVVVYESAPGDAVPYCATSPNSAGAGALLDVPGPISLTWDEITLQVSGAVPDQTGVFFYGPEQADLPFGDGTLCVGSGGLAHFRLNPPLPILPDGTAAHAVDLAQPPAGSGPGAWTAGSTWNVQLWYRDPAAGGTGINLSDAVSLTLLP